MTKPRGRYLLLKPAALAARVAAATELLAPCRLCPRECLTDRRNGEIGACATGEHPLVASWGPHFGEEPPLVGAGGSGTIFFGGCNLECVFCQNADISQLFHGGQCSPERLAAVMLALERRGCSNINLVSPTHVVPGVLRALSIAVLEGLSVPLVYNTGGYEHLATLALLNDVVDIYMPDMKYADAGAGLCLSGVPDYPERNQAAVLEMHRQVGDLRCIGPDGRTGVAAAGLLIRHLVLPGGLAGTADIARFVAQRVSTTTAFNLMRQYYPCYQAYRHPPLDRRVTAEEWRAARCAVLAAGLRPMRDN